VDLYLIHHPRLAKPDLATAWREFEKIKADGLAKWVLVAVGLSLFCIDRIPRSIGVSNFGVNDLEALLSVAKVKPAVNQVSIHCVAVAS
jgi:diketogulonate reductase-like aldo/keto reductase